VSAPPCGPSPGLLDRSGPTGSATKLKWLADLLGEVRDTDVLLERFSEHLAALPEQDAEPGRRLLERLNTQRDQARRRLLGAMATDKYAQLLEDLVAAAAAPALLPGADRPAAEVMPPLVAKPWKKLRKEVARAATTRRTTSSTRSASGPSGPATPPRRSSR
jgi:CHAD domain-containing protein